MKYDTREANSSSDTPSQHTIAPAALAKQGNTSAEKPEDLGATADEVTGGDPAVAGRSRFRGANGGGGFSERSQQRAFAVLVSVSRGTALYGPLNRLPPSPNLAMAASMKSVDADINSTPAHTAADLESPKTAIGKSTSDSGDAPDAEGNGDSGGASAEETEKILVGADTVLCASGALHTAVLLLKSGLKGNGKVGKHLRWVKEAALALHSSYFICLLHSL